MLETTKITKTTEDHKDQAADTASARRCFSSPRITTCRQIIGVARSLAHSHATMLPSSGFGHSTRKAAVVERTMAKRNLTERVEVLEQTVGVGETLSDRVSAVEVQVLQLRSEMRDEFAAVRAEMRGEFAAVRAEMRAGDEGLRAEVGAVEALLREEIRAVDEALRQEIRTGEAETRRHMRVLHEEVISRIAALQESRHENE
jgi:hypothetical protein